MLVMIAAFISPFRNDRDVMRNSMPPGRFVEIFVDCPLEVCEKRDTKGLYLKARKGEITNFVGIDLPYEEPQSPEIVVNTSQQSIDECLQLIKDYIDREFFLGDSYQHSEAVNGRKESQKNSF